MSILESPKAWLKRVHGLDWSSLSGKEAKEWEEKWCGSPVRYTSMFLPPTTEGKKIVGEGKE